jgi:hypothetical protein
MAPCRCPDPRRDCTYMMIKTEYIDPKAGRPGWIFIYPGQGPIIKDNITGVTGLTLQEAMNGGPFYRSKTPGPGSSTYNSAEGVFIVRGAVLREGNEPNFAEYCREANRPLSYPRY